MRVGFITAIDATVVGLVRGVYMRMLLSVRRVGKTPIAALVFALERFLTRVCALVYLEILTAGKHLATARMGAGKGLLAGMNAYVIDQLVLGLEGSSIPGATNPEAGMCGTFWSAHMLHGQMCDNLVHRVKDLVACFSRRL